MFFESYHKICVDPDISTLNKIKQIQIDIQKLKDRINNLEKDAGNDELYLINTRHSEIINEVDKLYIIFKSKNYKLREIAILNSSVIEITRILGDKIKALMSELEKKQ